MNTVELKIVVTTKQYLNWSFRSIFKREKQFQNGAIAIEKEKYRIKINQPIYIETNILGLSKVLMQNVHCN